MEGDGGGMVSQASGGASAGHVLHPSGGSGLVQQQHSAGGPLEAAIKQQDDEQRQRITDRLKGELEKLRVHSQNTLERLKIAVRASALSNHPAVDCTMGS
jgi:hypothetical protein